MPEMIAVQEAARKRSASVAFLDEIRSRYVTRKELANALGICERTIARYEGTPDGLPSLVIGGKKFYRMASVENWLAAREVHPNRRRAK